ncbi:hypothetical protein ACFVZH_02460 [Streptomyces sp. NPDC059534]|uniref:hypothetical protein n=1 Tax=Streptomyces sp. NPDC059534 TaxID=3346859 RepID=UPI0036B601DD
MSITVNAHQLGLLIDKTIAHIGDETIKPLHGIRLDVDGRYLYAVASDRYTLAAARYKLNHDDTAQEPWACTIPGTSLKALREWTAGHKGGIDIGIQLDDNVATFNSAQATFSVNVDCGLEFPDWRGLIHTMTEYAVEEQPFPSFNSSMLARFGNAESYLHVRLTADRKAALLVSEDFIGAVMPTDSRGLGPVSLETFEKARDLWQWTLAAGGKGVEMDTAMPKPDQPATGAVRTVPAAGEESLREVLRATWDLHDVDYHADGDLWFAYIRVAVANWIAFRYLDALHQVDPRAARQVVEDTAEQLDSGEIGEWAWDTAKQAGHDPQQWENEHRNAVAAHREKQPPEWAERLATGLNAAKGADIGFHVDDNPHVVYDEQAEQWTAVKPETAKA